MHTSHKIIQLQAGFASPDVELSHKVSAATAEAESAKDLLNRIKPYTSPGWLLVSGAV